MRNGKQKPQSQIKSWHFCWSDFFVLFDLPEKRNKTKQNKKQKKNKTKQKKPIRFVQYY